MWRRGKRRPVRKSMGGRSDRRLYALAVLLAVVLAAPLLADTDSSRSVDSSQPPMPRSSGFPFGKLTALSNVEGQPESPQTAAIAALREAVREYVRLVKEISPDYLPGDMSDYPAATDMLEKLGERLELLSREATNVERQGGDWSQLRQKTAELHDDLLELRGFSAPLRAYSHCIRARIKRPRWAIAQVPASQFISPPVHDFQGTFSQKVALGAVPGQLLHCQLVAVPINRDIECVEVELPGRLSGPGLSLADLDMKCHLAATRSTPLEPEQREWEICPYRLRPCDKMNRLQADLVQPYWFTMQVPEDAAPGVYGGRIKFTARDVHSLDLELRLTISENSSD